MRPLTPLFALTAAFALTSCHSGFIEATISNRTPEPLSLVELDYPSASFGTQTLAPGHDFHYRFKILGHGPATVLWTDSAHHDHKNSGPVLQEGEEGSLVIGIEPGATASWNLQLVKR